MAQYIRAYDGRTYFFTLVTYRRQPILCLEPARVILREVIREVRACHPFVIDAWVLLPDHLHCMWTLPDDDRDYSKRWGLIKAGFTRRAKEAFELPVANDSRRKHREGTIWQRRFWEHMIRDEEDYRNHCDYIHYNPVKHGLARTPAAWPYSTFHRLAAQGVYPGDWCAEPVAVYKNGDIE